MNPLLLAGIYLFKLIAYSYLYLLTIRFWLQKCRVNYFNPLSQLIIKCTNPVIKPVRYVIPGYKGFDLAILFLMIILQWLIIVMLTFFSAGDFPAFVASFLSAVVALATLNCDLFVVLVIVSALSSWFPTLQRHPAVEIVSKLVSPLLVKVRRHVPLVGGMDFSPVVVIVSFHLLSILVLTPLMSVFLQLSR